ncbi:MAG: MBL fold metallo-hydrolase [Acutalibacteraceae bacterium]
MKITWLGQAGFYLECEDLKVMIDPYLSDYCEKLNPNSFRRTSKDERFLKIKPDVLICTHNHADHYDPETVKYYFDNNKNMTFLSPESVFRSAVSEYKGNANLVRFQPHTVWTQGGAEFTAVKAEHSDPWAIGVIIRACGKTLYFSGDTLYNTDLLADLPKDIDYAFIPVNGVGNNMNMTDAVKFADAVGAKKAVPVHIGMFDNISPREFSHPSALYLMPYKEQKL